jgi:hypothetical protein
MEFESNPRFNEVMLQFFQRRKPAWSAYAPI